jgi:hypothetical protein
MSDKINEKVYQIRRGILRFLNENVIDGDLNNVAYITVEQLIELRGNAALQCASADDIRKEFAELKKFGYIEALQGFNGQYCKISPKGLEQLSIEFPQDYFVHGPGAIK